MKIYITGISGTGKSAIAKELKSRGVYAFDIEEIEGLCYWTDKKTGEKVLDYSPTLEWLETHDWICNVEKLKELLESGTELVIATGITSNQAECLRLFEKVFLLQSPEQILSKRMATRYLNPGENNFGQHEEERDFALNGLKEFEDDMISKGAVPIDSSVHISEVADKILAEINN